ncbi:RNA polymerase sigma factor SigF [Streptomyces sp. WI04-05B]|uniref:RNA polymerase sigma factor SigF n=1 Tax=Streptomyces TaxID=1883 RepID=UPI0029BBE5C8|nr:MULTISPECIES: RNA polymerase sigma factor SigF [unclassified Streptomyces]MDX2542070.1 RNA polymerase sigma factor SigF [Streptomyces sp. WI04-05B]MDX2583902.1 RNA polymerase sigma factor SigF [Streptomyces sp. WI04-05A]MDX3750386.1 RNA polymerase sigma factor SigF [Streptomyces sp. AK08-02]
MRNGDGPVRDEERGTRELPGAGGGGPDGPRSTADAASGIAGISGIPEQARPHPEDNPPEAGFMDDGQLDREGAVQSAPLEGPSEVSPVPADARAQGRSTGGTMSEHERDDAQGAQPAVQVTSTSPTDRSGARALFYELRALENGSAEYAELRNRLVRMHLPLVEHLARRFRNRGEPLDDLTQVATIGLIKSVDRFDPDRGVEFSTYATPTVVGEIKRHFRDKGWAVRVPRRLQELRLSLTTATAELSQRHGRSPTVHELAEKLGISEEEVLEGLESANAYSTLSLDVPDTDDESPAVADTLGSYDEALEGVEYRESLKPLLEDLPPREKRILLLRFFGNMTQSQIAQEVGISQMHVSRLLARTLAQLRERLLVEE